MNGRKNGRPVGSLKISQDVIATIASVAVLETEGADSLAQPTGSIHRLFPGGIGKKAIQVDLSDDFVEITISINLKYGAKINEVCTKIQSAVKENVQTMTGMAVSKVNIIVAGITFAEQSAASGQAPES